MAESAREKACGIISAERVEALEKAGLQVVEVAPLDAFVVKLMRLNAIQHSIISDCLTSNSCSRSAWMYFETEMRLKCGDTWRERLDDEVPHG